MYLWPCTALPFAFRQYVWYTVAEMKFSAPYVVLWQCQAEAFLLLCYAI